VTTCIPILLRYPGNELVILGKPGSRSSFPDAAEDSAYSKEDLLIVINNWQCMYAYQTIWWYSVTTLYYLQHVATLNDKER
jgi:hypothetical protein